MTFGCCGQRALPHRTPGDYLQAVKSFQRIGSPRAPTAAKAALLAYATAEAHRKGDKRRAQAGLKGLAMLADAESAELTRVQRQIGSRAASIRGQIMAYAQLASGIAGIIAGASGDANVVKVVQWIDAILLGRTPPTGVNLSVFADFCRVWNGGVGLTATALVRAVGAAITTASRGADTNAARIAEMLAGFVETAAGQICSLVQIPGTGDPSNCNELMCGVAQMKQINSAGTECECVPIPPAASFTVDPVVAARREWLYALTARQLLEAVLVGNPTHRMAVNNCPYACTLEYAEASYIAALRAAGRPPTIPASPSGAPGTSTPRRFINAATAPSGCRCTAGYEDPSGAGEKPSAVAMATGALAVAGLGYFLTRK